MTLRKYKKLLMSYGIDRDLAEEKRKCEAIARNLLKIEGSDLRLDPERTARVLLETCNGSLKKQRHNKSVTLRRIRETVITV